MYRVVLKGSTTCPDQTLPGKSNPNPDPDPHPNRANTGLEQRVQSCLPGVGPFLFSRFFGLWKQFLVGWKHRRIRTRNPTPNLRPGPYPHPKRAKIDQKCPKWAKTDQTFCSAAFAPIEKFPKCGPRFRSADHYFPALLPSKGVEKLRGILRADSLLELLLLNARYLVLGESVQPAVTTSQNAVSFAPSTSYIFRATLLPSVQV